MSASSDFSLSFLLHGVSLRGRFVRLDHVTSSVISKHAYPDAVSHWLSNFMVATVGLASLMKFEGIFTLQTKSSGPLSMVVVDVNSEGDVRGYGQYAEDMDALASPLMATALGSGYLAFTVDQGFEQDRYQGIVKLEGETLEGALEHYFQQSEQLKTRCLIFSRRRAGRWQSAALILQQLPEKEANADGWDYVNAVLGTLSEEEIFDVEGDVLMHRLFHEMEPEMLSLKEYKPQCRCSEGRVKNFLHSLSEEDLEDLLSEGPLEMRCEFCNHSYTFNRSDLMQIH